MSLTQIKDFLLRYEGVNGYAIVTSFLDIFVLLDEEYSESRSASFRVVDFLGRNTGGVRVDTLRCRKECVLGNLVTL